MLVALTLTLPLSYAVLSRLCNASGTMFGRDQGIYQYVAWAVSQGAVDYVDICDINGPLTHAVHQVFQALGGSSERGFRILDLGVASVTFAIAGASLPGLTWRPGTTPPALAPRLAWAAAAWTLLSVQYLAYEPWDLAQREGFCNWFVLTSAALQLLAQGNAGPLTTTRHRTLLIVAGTLSVMPWFIKPTYAACTALQALLLLERGTWRRQLIPFAAGGVLAVTLMLAWVARFGDISAFLRSYLFDGPRLYGPIWPVSPAELLKRTGFPHWGGYALIVAGTAGVLVWRRTLPRRILLVGLLPVTALVQIVVQGKGFDYHYHTLTAAVTFGVLALACALSEMPHRWGVTVVPTLALAGVAALMLSASPYSEPRWLAYRGSSYATERPELRDHFFYMRYFPRDHGRAAEYLAKTTEPSDRVFLYASSPYLLFLAQRLGAACPLYACQLNVRAALDGRSPSRIYTPGTPLDPARAATIRAIRDRYEAATLSQLKANPPAALAFVDDEPFMSVANAWVDFRLQNPQTASWLLERYAFSRRFGTVQVWEPKRAQAKAANGATHG